MKKNIIFILLYVVSIMRATSQDTVRYGDSCYLFNSININNIIPTDDNHNACSWGLGYLLGYEYQLQQKTNIYGIAATVRRDSHDNDSAGYTIYLCTTLNGTDLLVIDSATRYSRETHYVYMAMDGNNVVETTVPCYEYFFSQPHNLQGTIYIGSKYDSNFFDHTDDYYHWVPCLNTSFDNSIGQRWITIDTTNPIQILEGRRWYWGGYFPIIQPEPIECTAERVKVTERWEDHVVLEWDMEGDSCQLSITPYGMPIDSGIVVGLQTGSYTVTDLDRGVYYVARLKTLCHHHCPIHADMPVWSDWGSPTIIPLGNQGINTAKNTPKWSLTPNPAHGSVTVQCDEGIMEVEIISMKGESLQHHNAVGAQSCAIDLTGFNKGIYIVQITTPQGTAARKLAVE